jgi:hypothetical protein
VLASSVVVLPLVGLLTATANPSLQSADRR